MVSVDLRVTVAGVCLIVCIFSSAADPIVTLSHGGQLRGLRTTFQGSCVDLFLGVRYADPPVGCLRFKKTQELPGWRGVVDARSVGNVCPQLAIETKQYMGSEDCLFLDITVPGGVKTGAKLPVMVWIHGGGFVWGEGSGYIGAALATTGDVIVVTINYRLGILGFLADYKGTGNYGLWDQRAALLWVKQNIEQFGGDPDLVTIFGESAGSGSVSSHTIGQHSEGLFKRAIMQSGSAFIATGVSNTMRSKWDKAIRDTTNCGTRRDIFACMEEMTAEEIITQIIPVGAIGPVKGEDFVDELTSQTESYNLSRRYDILSGMNGQEGGLAFEYETVATGQAQNKSVKKDGVDMDVVRESLRIRCEGVITPVSPDLCINWVIKTYKLDEAADDKERASRLLSFLGEQFFDEEIVNQLKQHSPGSTSTYAYYFTELYKRNPSNPAWSIPDCLKTSADHGEEVPFVFGNALITDDMRNNSIWNEILKVDEFTKKFAGGIQDKHRPLSNTMMTMWTNFAKSGNPNLPVALPADIPEWPEFNTDSNQFMELNSQHMRVITTPNKERLESIRQNLHSARRLQRNIDQRPEISSFAQRSGGY